MISDAAFNFSVEQDITTETPGFTGFALSENYYDMREAGLVSAGELLLLHCRITETIAGGTPQFTVLPTIWPGNPALSVAGLIGNGEPPLQSNAAFARFVAQSHAFANSVQQAPNVLAAGNDIFVPVSGHANKSLIPYKETGLGIPYMWRWLNVMYQITPSLTTGKVTTTLTTAAAIGLDTGRFASAFKP